MKKYIVKFDSSFRNKIPSIKLIRRMTNLSLKDVKEFVDKTTPIHGEFELLVTELQLGRFFIGEEIMCRQIPDSPESRNKLLEIKELEEPSYVDISMLGS